MSEAKDTAPTTSKATATSKSKKPTRAQLEAELEKSRATIEQLSTTTAGHLAAIRAMSPAAGAPQLSNVMVGVRSISDNTIALVSPFGDPTVSLHGTAAGQNAGSFGAISFAWWQTLRNGKLLASGQIMRDDSILGDLYNAAPADRQDEMHAEWEQNAVVDAAEWIKSRSAEELQDGINKMTSEASLRRIRRVVDDELRKLQDAMLDDPERAEKSVKQLPAKLRLVDELVTSRLERELNQR